jgi:hypothetical protein
MRKVVILILAVLLAACNKNSSIYKVEEELTGTIAVNNGMPNKIDSIAICDNIRAEYQPNNECWGVIIRVNGENISVRFSMNDNRFKKMLKTLESTKKSGYDWRTVRITKITVFKKDEESFQEIDSAYELRDL